MAHLDIQALRETVEQYEKHFSEVPIEMTAQLPIMKAIVQYSDMEERCMLRIKAAEEDIMDDRKKLKRAIERQKVALEALQQIAPVGKEKTMSKDIELEQKLQKNKVF